MENVDVSRPLFKEVGRNAHLNNMWGQCLRGKRERQGIDRLRSRYTLFL